MVIHVPAFTPLPLKLCWILSLEWLANFKHIVQSFIDKCLFGQKAYLHGPMGFVVGEAKEVLLSQMSGDHGTEMLF